MLWLNLTTCYWYICVYHISSFRRRGIYSLQTASTPALIWGPVFIEHLPALSCHTFSHYVSRENQPPRNPLQSQFLTVFTLNKLGQARYLAHFGECASHGHSFCLDCRDLRRLIEARHLFVKISPTLAFNWGPAFIRGPASKRGNRVTI